MLSPLLRQVIEEGTTGFVVVPLPEWRSALKAAVPTDQEQTQVVADLRFGALSAGNVPEVGVRRDQAQMVLAIQPVETTTTPAPSTVTALEPGPTPAASPEPTSETQE